MNELIAKYKTRLSELKEKLKWLEEENLVLGVGFAIHDTEKEIEFVEEFLNSLVAEAPITTDLSEVKYQVYMWHTSESLGSMSVSHLYALPFKCIQLNKEKKYAFVSNCCFFKTH
jgi:hypothetical protein